MDAGVEVEPLRFCMWRSSESVESSDRVASCEPRCGALDICRRDNSIRGVRFVHPLESRFFRSVQRLHKELAYHII